MGSSVYTAYAQCCNSLCSGVMSSSHRTSWGPPTISGGLQFDIRDEELELVVPPVEWGDADM